MRELIKTVSRELSTDSYDAGQIIAGILRRRPYELYLVDEVSACARNAVLSCLAKLKKGMPLEYITGTVQFRDHTLRIDAGVFIPRAETEYMVELIQKSMRRDPGRILEIGTGCGAISIALASLYPDAHIIATDVSSEAIDNARHNIRDCALEHRIGLIRCSTYFGIRGEFDLIVSNPPYIPRPRIDHLPESVREFEPMLALDGGHRGTEFTQRLIFEGRDHMQGDGVMVFEIDEEAVDTLAGFLDYHKIGSFRFVKDLCGRYRYLFIGAPNEKS
ncbi:MAG: peptide chain release factor N(5)-glutamine methyltransferase [candidate division WOR-3 bacterium]|nr:peptide chain release factor N(5)-glutamine methyltransferase [candidate division WOR-3 bacterium]